MGLSGVEIHFGMNIGTRFVGRRRGHAQVDVLGRWRSQFFFGEKFQSVQTVRKGLGFCVAMILGFAVLDEEKDPGDEGHDADGDRGGDCGGGDSDKWFHGKPSAFVFHNLGDVDAVVTGFRERLFSLLNVFVIDVEFLDTGVFPDVVLELRFEAKGKGGIDGGVFQFEGTGVGDFVHGDAFVQFSDLIGDVGAAH